MIKQERQYEDVVLVEVDPQNDFCPDGKLGVDEGDQVMEPLNRLRQWALDQGGRLALTRDFHPAETTHFADYGGQWPEHCVAGTEGADFHPALDTEGATVFSKGMEADEDAYSGFQARTEDDVMLEDYLAETAQAEKVALVVGGLATDYCVKDTVLDARKRGFDTYVVTDAVRAVDIEAGDGQAALDAMAEAGATLTTTQEVLAGEIVDLRG